MRIRHARELLAGQLVFGDAEQIEALQTIEQWYSQSVSLEKIRAWRPCADRLAVFTDGLTSREWPWSEPIPIALIEEINGRRDVEWVLCHLERTTA